MKVYKRLDKKLGKVAILMVYEEYTLPHKAEETLDWMMEAWQKSELIIYNDGHIAWRIL